MLQSGLRARFLSGARGLGHLALPAVLLLPACADAGPEAEPAPPPAPAPAPSPFDLVLPNRWTGHYRVDSLSSAERGRAHPGALNFVYLPSDSTIRPQTLLVVATYDTAAWREALAEGGPPPGDSVAARGGLVFVVGLPQSNPFPPATADAILFDLLKLRPHEISGLIRPR